MIGAAVKRCQAKPRFAIAVSAFMIHGRPGRRNQAMSKTKLTYAHQDGVALLTLDNPPLNLMTLDMTRELNALIPHLAEDRAVRAMVLTGSGERAFCAGSDVKEFPQVADAVVQKKLALENEVYTRIAEFPKPTVAALNGLAFGGGLELAACCDLIIAEAGTMVALPEIKLGVFPGSGGTIRVTRRIGEGRAKEMMFLGDPVAVETALAWGLINRVVPRQGAVAVALEIARQLGAMPNVALQLCKQAIAMTFDRPEREAVEATLALSDRAFRTQDCAEGVRAFLAKEAPRFQ